MKRIFTFIFILFLPAVLSAEEEASSRKKFTFGAEWGYIGTFFTGYHNNFFSPDGWRVIESDSGFEYFNNSEVYVHCGYNIGNNWNISLYTGYKGVQNLYHNIPVSLRATRFFRENSKGDRWLAFVDLGSGISIKKNPQEILTGKLGAGYRISLNDRAKLDLITSLRVTGSHPPIIFDNIEIEYGRINRNNLYGCSWSIGVSLSF